MVADASLYGNIGRGVRSIADYDAERLAGQQNKLSLLLSQQKADEYGRSREEQEALRQYLGGGADLGTAEGQQGLYRAAPGLAGSTLKDYGSRQKDKADADEKRAATSAKEYDLQRKKLEHGILSLQASQSPQDAARAFQEGAALGYFTPEQAASAVQGIPQDPAQFGQWRSTQLARITDAKDQLPSIQTRNTGGSTDTLSVNRFTGVPTVTGSVRNTQSPDSIASGQVQMRGQNMTDARGREALDIARNRPTGAGPGGVRMSATLQKELIEAEDMAQTANSTAGTLRQALDLNKSAYSGVGADLRAQIRSNLPGQSKGADATVELKNLIGTQALQGMKAIFGGNPTEGERSILLDLQASSDKTPAQREAIIKRGIAAAEKRQKVNAERAKSIRSGTFLTEGADEPAADIDSLLDKYK